MLSSVGIRVPDDVSRYRKAECRGIPLCSSSASPRIRATSEIKVIVVLATLCTLTDTVQQDVRTSVLEAMIICCKTRVARLMSNIEHNVRHGKH